MEERIETSPGKGEACQRIVREYLDPGKWMNDISMDLNAEGIQTRNGSSSRWSNGTLSRIFKRPDYLDQITVNGFVTDARGKIIAPRPEREHIVLEAPPLITKNGWDRLQERLHSSNSHGGGKCPIRILKYRLCFNRGDYSSCVPANNVRCSILL